VIEFPVTFKEAEQDHSLQERLLQEAPGILNWALEGYLLWKKQGLDAPEAVKLATKTYLTENDSVGQFIDARCIKDPKAKETTGNLHADSESCLPLVEGIGQHRPSMAIANVRTGFSKIQFTQGSSFGIESGWLKTQTRVDEYRG
jgi:hypothetical protein